MNQKSSSLLVSILGDSISSFAGYVPVGEGYKAYYDGTICGVSSVKETWWMRLITDLGWTLCRNNSVSGSCCSTGARQDRVSACLKQRTGALADERGNAPDVILIYIGTNDFYRCVKPGSWDGEGEIPADVRTFREAYATMLRDVKRNYPNARVFCCTLPYSVRTEPGHPITGCNEIGIPRTEWNAIIRRMADLFDCEVIDLDASGFCRENIYRCTGDGHGLHPNAEGHRLLYLKCREALAEAGLR